MKKAISNYNVAKARFEEMPFDGEWLASFGCPAPAGCWLIYGGSGSGKTTFGLQAAKYLSRFGRVAYNSLEQGWSKSLQGAWEREGMIECGKNVELEDRLDFADMNIKLLKRNARKIWIIDSINYWDGQCRIEDIKRMLEKHGDKLFVFIAHESGTRPKGSIAQRLYYHADVKARARGYRLTEINSRFSDTRGGGADFTIWREGADNYWIEKL